MLFTWLFVVPLLTCWMWRLAFLTSFSQVSLQKKMLIFEINVEAH